MHSVRRIKTTAQQREARRKKEAVAIAQFRELNDDILKRNQAGPEALNKTTKLLLTNPEHYTVWNIRRELISQLEPAAKQPALMNDLKLIESLLPTHPKVYWIWNHRRWTLNELSSMTDNKDVWTRELALVTKLLERDSRNFHGWYYRRWVVSQAPALSSLTNEFAFTTKKINENYSNFSAWHCRAQLIPEFSAEDRPSVLDELKYVYEAVAMDPQDQSGWLYYQWLLETPLYESEISESLLVEQRELVAELWEEEQSLWAGRMLCEIDNLLNRPSTDAQIVHKLGEIDPLRKERYQDMLLNNT